MRPLLFSVRRKNAQRRSQNVRLELRALPTEPAGHSIASLPVCFNSTQGPLGRVMWTEYSAV